MRNAALAAALLVSLAGVRPAPAAAGVVVTFENVSSYDRGDLRNPARRAGIVREFDRHFRRLAARYLAPDRSLRIDVLDLDLAGYGEPLWRGPGEPRILTGATPPRFKLRYALKAGGRTLVAGTEVVRDPNYLWNPSARLSQERFVYEKATLTEWFRDRFVRIKPPRS